MWTYRTSLREAPIYLLKRTWLWTFQLDDNRYGRFRRALKLTRAGISIRDYLLGSRIPIFTHREERVAREALLRAIKRPIDFAGVAESGVISRMETSPATYTDGDSLPPRPDSFLDILRSRISLHTKIGLLCSAPLLQPIDAETATHFLGLGGIIVMAATIISAAGRMRAN